jgi:hypothetical protein
MAGALSAMIAAIFSGGVTSDLFFEYTTLLLPGNGTNGAQNNTFLDGSTNNFTITRNGNTTQGTFSPFSQTGWGNYFDGSGDYLSVASNAAFAFGTGDFTIEFWFYPTTGVARNITFPITGAPIFYMNGSRQLQFETYGAPPSVTTTNTLNLNTWNHCAVSRASGTVKVFVNGATGVTSTAFSATSFVQSSVNIGTDAGSNFATGYMSNVRIVKGTAVYTSDFTPPTTPLTAISGTSLLTCQSNRFIDNSSNNFTITVNGNTSVQAFSPFNPTASWSAATYGGSGYFDGTGDYLDELTATTAFNLSTGDWTIEAWIYRNASGVAHTILSLYNTAGSNSGLTFYVNASNQLVTDNGVNAALAAGSVGASQWVHIAIVRSGGTTTGYINGTSVGTTTQAASAAQYARIGALATGASTFNGYIANLRIVKGTAVYTGAFTPPSLLPLTNAGSTSAAAYPSTTNVNTSFASSATSLLLNFTNAGIYDATSKNDLETVGNAQISTAQFKFSPSSIAFDGTGDYLTSNPATTDMYAFGSGDFTIEFWLRLNTVSGTQVVYDQRPTSGGVYPAFFMSGSTLTYFVNGVSRITTTLSSGIWYHIALSRSGTSTKLFVNGAQAGSTYTDSNVYLNTALRPVLGADATNFTSNWLNGYLQDVRVTKGYARYTANFTAPTAAFPTL